jgi:hypothetical protein
MTFRNQHHLLDRSNIPSKDLVNKFLSFPPDVFTGINRFVSRSLDHGAPDPDDYDDVGEFKLWQWRVYLELFYSPTLPCQNTPLPAQFDPDLTWFY